MNVVKFKTIAVKYMYIPSAALYIIAQSGTFALCLSLVPALFYNIMLIAPYGDGPLDSVLPVL